jgi:hypothetical protein
MASSLLISSIIQAATLEFSAYHAFIMLNLCWMLISNALVICVLPTIDAQIEIGWRRYIGSFWPSRVGQFRAVLLVSIHLSALGAVGFWLWFIKSSPSTLCAQTAVVYVFMAPLSRANPSLRIASLVVYAIAAIPIFNIIVFTAIAVSIVNIINAFIPTPYTFGRLYRIAALIQAIVNGCLIASTELTVDKNKDVVDSQRSGWGFGQILVLLLGIGPILAALHVITGKIERECWKLWMAKVDFWIRKGLKTSGEPWDDLYKKTKDGLNAVVVPLQSTATRMDFTALTAVKHSIGTAQAFLSAANKSIQTSRTHEEKDVEESGSIATTTTISITVAAKEISRMHEMISIACDIRFREIQDYQSSLAAKAYLEATRDALGAAKIALDAYCLTKPER